MSCNLTIAFLSQTSGFDLSLWFFVLPEFGDLKPVSSISTVKGLTADDLEYLKKTPNHFLRNEKNLRSLSPLWVMEKNTPRYIPNVLGLIQPTQHLYKNWQVAGIVERPNIIPARVYDHPDLEINNQDRQALIDSNVSLYNLFDRGGRNSNRGCLRFEDVVDGRGVRTGTKVSDPNFNKFFKQQYINNICNKKMFVFNSVINRMELVSSQVREVPQGSTRSFQSLTAEYVILSNNHSRQVIDNFFVNYDEDRLQQLNLAIKKAMGLQSNIIEPLVENPPFLETRGISSSSTSLHHPEKYVTRQVIPRSSVVTMPVSSTINPLPRVGLPNTSIVPPRQAAAANNGALLLEVPKNNFNIVSESRSVLSGNSSTKYVFPSQTGGLRKIFGVKNPIISQSTVGNPDVVNIPHTTMCGIIDPRFTNIPASEITPVTIAEERGSVLTSETQGVREITETAPVSLSSVPTLSSVVVKPAATTDVVAEPNFILRLNKDDLEKLRLVDIANAAANVTLVQELASISASSQQGVTKAAEVAPVLPEQELSSISLGNEKDEKSIAFDFNILNAKQLEMVPAAELSEIFNKIKNVKFTNSGELIIKKFKWENPGIEPQVISNLALEFEQGKSTYRNMCLSALGEEESSEVSDADLQKRFYAYFYSIELNMRFINNDLATKGGDSVFINPVIYDKMIYELNSQVKYFNSLEAHNTSSWCIDQIDEIRRMRDLVLREVGSEPIISLDSLLANKKKQVKLTATTTSKHVEISNSDCDKFLETILPKKSKEEINKFLASNKANKEIQENLKRTLKESTAELYRGLSKKNASKEIDALVANYNQLDIDIKKILKLSNNECFELHKNSALRDSVLEILKKRIDEFQERANCQIETWADLLDKIHAKYPEKVPSGDSEVITAEDEFIDFQMKKMETVWPDFPARYFIEYDRSCLTKDECVSIVKPIFTKLYGGYPPLYKEKLSNFLKNYALFDAELNKQWPTDSETRVVNKKIWLTHYSKILNNLSELEFRIINEGYNEEAFKTDPIFYNQFLKVVKHNFMEQHDIFLNTLKIVPPTLKEEIDETFSELEKKF